MIANYGSKIVRSYYFSIFSHISNDSKRVNWSILDTPCQSNNLSGSAGEDDTGVWTDCSDTILR